MLNSLEKQIGYTFKKICLLQQALTHSSFTHEKENAASYERLEFLGDAVLELSISELLYTHYKDLPEGELTKRRSALVCEPSLAMLARELNIGNLLRLGHGEKMSGGQERDSLLSDSMEAIFGAVYLDGGFNNAREVIARLFTKKMEQASRVIDNKTVLQEEIQKYSREPIIYTIVDETGPAHYKEFTVMVSHDGRELGTGTGRNKKEAEQNAAMKALKAVINNKFFEKPNN